MFRYLLLFLAFSVLTNAEEIYARRPHGVKEIEHINPIAATPQWGRFKQPLDHFNPLDKNTWTMRYISNDQFFQEGGPIFIYLGGEWSIQESSLMTGQIFDLAREHNGTMFYTEHRFYGRSYPADDYSLENFKYHTTDQALEDIANFIKYYKSLEIFQNSKVVVIGGAYSAMLATWMRLKYPHLVDIAYSSSAPVEAIVDFYEYMEVVNDVIEEKDPECLKIIREGLQEINEGLLEPNGHISIGSYFKVCDYTVDISVDPERTYFLSFMIWPWAEIVQYATNEIIEKYCSVVKEEEGTNTKKLLAFLEAYYGEYECLGNYNDYMWEHRSTKLTEETGRQWEYQACTQYGFYQTTNSDSQPFGKLLPIEYFTRFCQDVFGFDEEVLKNGVDRTNVIYGAKEVAVTKVVNVHGANDPWNRAGIVSGDINQESPTIVIEGASHCQDLSSANEETDSPQLYAAKIRIKEIIGQWLEKDNGNDDDDNGGDDGGNDGGDDDGNGGDDDGGDDDTSSPAPPDDGGDDGSAIITVSNIMIVTVVLLISVM